jgi:hypothetical protein
MKLSGRASPASTYCWHLALFMDIEHQIHMLQGGRRKTQAAQVPAREKAHAETHNARTKSPLGTNQSQANNSLPPEKATQAQHKQVQHGDRNTQPSPAGLKPQQQKIRRARSMGLGQRPPWHLSSPTNRSITERTEERQSSTGAGKAYAESSQATSPQPQPNPNLHKPRTT